MQQKRTALVSAMIFSFALAVSSYAHSVQNKAPQAAGDDSDARPPVTKADLEIVEHAGKMLDSPDKWNRADNRKCPPDEKTFSLYCALEQSTREVTGGFAHRGAAMQEARFVIEELAPDWKKYNHRLMDYNNDPKTTFADVQKFFQLLRQRIEKRLNQQSQSQTPKN
jgi:hypothetical protein